MTANEYEWLVPIPEGISGEWRVEKFTVSEKEARFDALRAMISTSAMGRHTPAGSYTALKRGGTIVMSTTADEMRDFRAELCRVQRPGLIAGLGLGCAVSYVLGRRNVPFVTVVEKSPDVIALVGPYLEKAFPGRMQIICADIFEWKPPAGAHCDWAYYDIWDNICPDNLPEMTRLKRKFGRRTGYQACWCEKRLRQYELSNKMTWV